MSLACLDIVGFGSHQVVTMREAGVFYFWTSHANCIDWFDCDPACSEVLPIGQ